MISFAVDAAGSFSLEASSRRALALLKTELMDLVRLPLAPALYIHPPIPTMIASISAYSMMSCPFCRLILSISFTVLLFDYIIF